MAITAALVKELREKTGAGMMDCKKALSATDGDMDKAIDFLREKGLASAAKKAGRVAAEGVVTSYIHAGGRIGVLVEVATDVVNDEIKEMAKNVAMQVAAISPKYTSRDEVSKDYIEHETEILKVQAMNENPDKPENIIEKMIVGRLNKELKEVCLLDQAYVKAEDGKQAVGKYVEQVAKANGAHVTIKGFVRFETGEGIEKKEEDFAAEVAAQLK